MGDSSKGKTKASASRGDWQRAQMRSPDEASAAALRALQCPFRLPPETENHIPAEFTGRLAFLKAGEHNAPWTGYYANHNGHKLAVANYAGVWFEIRRRAHLGAATGVYNSRPSQQWNSRSRGGDVPRLISGRRIGAACANALDPNC